MEQSSAPSQPRESQKVIAIVEWEEADEQDESTASVIRRTKVRFSGNHEDCESVTNTIQQEVVRKIRKQKCIEENDSKSIGSDSSMDNYQILLYNPPTRDYHPLDSIQTKILSNKTDTTDPSKQTTWSQWTDYLGSRWRMQVLRQNNASSSSSSEHHSNQQVLAIRGRAFGAQSDNDAACFRIPNTDMTLRFRESWNQPDSTAFTVWDASLTLAHWLAENPHFVARKCVLELGAGCGLTGLTAAALGASRVYLTDLPDALPVKQVELNQHLWSTTDDDSTTRRRNAASGDSPDSSTIVECHALDWYTVLEDVAPFTADQLGAMKTLDFVNPKTSVVLVADCVWTLPLVEPLLATLAALQQHCSEPPVVMIAYQQRGRQTHEAFWNGLHKVFSTVNVLEIPTRAQNGNALFLWECNGVRKNE